MNRYVYMGCRRFTLWHPFEFRELLYTGSRQYIRAVAPSGRSDCGRKDYCRISALFLASVYHILRHQTISAPRRRNCFFRAAGLSQSKGNTHKRGCALLRFFPFGTPFPYLPWYSRCATADAAAVCSLPWFFCAAALPLPRRARLLYMVWVVIIYMHYQNNYFII